MAANPVEEIGKSGRRKWKIRPKKAANPVDDSDNLAEEGAKSGRRRQNRPKKAANPAEEGGESGRKKNGESGRIRR